MKNTVCYWRLAGFLFVSVMGTLLHFLFDWTGGNILAALFSAVNESIWEHLKLLFYPMVVFAIAEYFAWGRGVESFWCVKLVGILLGLAIIPVIYYTYTGILGIHADWLNITIFFFAAGVVFWAETKLLEKGSACRIGSQKAILLIGLTAILFTVFTYKPPHIPLFQDPITHTYGFQK